MGFEGIGEGLAEDFRGGFGRKEFCCEGFVADGEDDGFLGFGGVGGEEGEKEESFCVHVGGTFGDGESVRVSELNLGAGFPKNGLGLESPATMMLLADGVPGGF